MAAAARTSTSTSTRIGSRARCLRLLRALQQVLAVLGAACFETGVCAYRSSASSSFHGAPVVSLRLQRVAVGGLAKLAARVMSPLLERRILSHGKIGHGNLGANSNAEADADAYKAYEAAVCPTVLALVRAVAAHLAPLATAAMAGRPGVGASEVLTVLGFIDQFLRCIAVEPASAPTPGSVFGPDAAYCFGCLCSGGACKPVEVGAPARALRCRCRCSFTPRLLRCSVRIIPGFATFHRHQEEEEEEYDDDKNDQDADNGALDGHTQSQQGQGAAGPVPEDSWPTELLSLDSSPGPSSVQAAAPSGWGAGVLDLLDDWPPSAPSNSAAAARPLGPPPSAAPQLGMQGTGDLMDLLGDLVTPGPPAQSSLTPSVSLDAPCGRLLQQ